MILLDNQSNYWLQGDFWISISFGVLGCLISLIGVYYSRKAFSEAELAKNAANEAGVVVKTQEIIMELERISHSCQFNENIGYSEANIAFNEISGKVYGIVGLYKGDEDINEEVLLIQEHIQSIKNALETANRANPSSIYSSEGIDQGLLVNYVYNITAPHFSNLIGSLNKLKGILNSRLIKKQ